jgi:hypothetical protein
MEGESQTKNANLASSRLRNNEVPKINVVTKLGAHTSDNQGSHPLFKIRKTATIMGFDAKKQRTKL